MSEILHANIFFFIASIATVVFSIMLCVALYQVIKILRSLRILVERIEAGSDVIAEDIQSMRDFVMRGGFISHLMRLVVGGVKKGSNLRTRKATKDIVITDKE